MSEPVIIVNNVSKLYPVNRDIQGLKEYIVRLTSLKRANKEQYPALKNISFTVNKGECLGIIGKNGAGKGTMLGLLLGTTHPTEGEITVHGKRTPLLELGAGFHPDLTGEENSYWTRPCPKHFCGYTYT